MQISFLPLQVTLLWKLDLMDVEVFPITKHKQQSAKFMLVVLDVL